MNTEGNQQVEAMNSSPISPSWNPLLFFQAASTGCLFLIPQGHSFPTQSDIVESTRNMDSKYVCHLIYLLHCLQAQGMADPEFQRTEVRRYQDQEKTMEHKVNVEGWGSQKQIMMGLIWAMTEKRLIRQWLGRCHAEPDLLTTFKKVLAAMWQLQSVHRFPSHYPTAPAERIRNLQLLQHLVSSWDGVL